MLTLVRPSPEGQDGGDPPVKRRRRALALSLTPAESARLRATLKNLKRAYGSYACLAEVMGVSKDALYGAASGNKPGSPALLLLAARAAGTTIEALLAPLGSVEICLVCGAGKGGA